MLGVLWRPPEGFLSPLPVTVLLFADSKSPQSEKKTFLLLNPNPCQPTLANPGALKPTHFSVRPTVCACKHRPGPSKRSAAFSRPRLQASGQQQTACWDGTLMDEVCDGARSETNVVAIRSRGGSPGEPNLAARFPADAAACGGLTVTRMAKPLLRPKSQYALVTYDMHEVSGHDNRSDIRRQALLGTEEQRRWLPRVMVSGVGDEEGLKVLATASKRPNGHGSTRMERLSVSQWNKLFKAVVCLLTVDDFKRLQTLAQEQKWEEGFEEPSDNQKIPSTVPSPCSGNRCTRAKILARNCGCGCWLLAGHRCDCDCGCGC